MSIELPLNPQSQRVASRPIILFTARAASADARAPLPTPPSSPIATYTSLLQSPDGVSHRFLVTGTASNRVRALVTALLRGLGAECTDLYDTCDIVVAVGKNGDLAIRSREPSTCEEKVEEPLVDASKPLGIPDVPSLTAITAGKSASLQSRAPSTTGDAFGLSDRPYQ